MGDPKKQRKKYYTPSHPWQKERIEEEKELLKKYGLKNKREIWKMKSMLKKFAQQAKRLVALKGPQYEIEKKQLMDKLISFGLIEPNAQLEDILTITVKDIMERRIQTVVYNKTLSRSIKQARQFITHRHVAIGNDLVTFPSYLVTKNEEDKIIFIPSSPLFNHEHPERMLIKEKSKPRKSE